MNFPFQQTDVFYPGFQKLSLFEDSVFRRGVLAVALMALISIPLYLSLPTRYNEIIMVVRDILLLVPMVFWLCGGVSRRAWILYVLFGALFLAGFIPLRSGAPPVFAVFLAASAGVLIPLLREAPHVPDQLGMANRQPLLKELLVTATLAAALVIITYLAIVLLMPQWMPEATFRILSFRTYALMACVGLLHYGALYGILYGILFRRLLTMRFTLSVPILINCALLFLTWVPDAFDNSNPALAFISLLFTCLGIQFFMGMGFYFCRTTRVVLFAHVVYFIYTKSVLLGG